MPVYIELVDGKIQLNSPWFPGVADMCKSIPGAKWDPDNKLWRYPANMTVCRKARKVFGEQLQIGPDLWVWAREKQADEARAVALSRQKDADLEVTPRVAPKLAQAMAQRVYQRAGSRFLAERRTAGILDEPGLGKTAALLSAVMEAGLWRRGTHHLVIAPKTAVTSTWPNEIVKWCGYYDDGGPEVYPITGAQKLRHATIETAIMPRDTPDGYGDAPVFIIINPNMLQVKMEDFCKKCDMWLPDIVDDPKVLSRHVNDEHKCKSTVKNMEYPELFDIEWDSIIADECNRYLLKLRPGRKGGKIPQWAEGAKRLRIKDGGLKLTATGTPFRGKEYNIFGILYWMNPEEYPSYWNWVDTYLHKSDNGFGIDIGSVRDECRDDFDRMLSKSFIRRTRKEVRSELPDQMIIDHWVDLEGKHAKQYKQFETEGLARLDSGEVQSVGVLAELTRLRQFSFGCWDTKRGTDKLVPVGPSPKLDMLFDMLAERGLEKNSESEMKFIIASQFTQLIDWIQKQLEEEGIRALKITGAVSGKKRDAVVKSFNDDPAGPKVLLVNTTAGGESITLDAMCDEMFILDETFIEDDQIQLRGRIDNRGNRAATRIYHYIRTRGTIEESIAQGNIDQSNLQTELLDKRRGVETAIRLLKGHS